MKIKATVMTYRLTTIENGVKTVVDFDSTRERQTITTIERVAAPTRSQEKKRAQARRKRGVAR